jgi:hypothetical protein
MSPAERRRELHGYIDDLPDSVLEDALETLRRQYDAKLAHKDRVREISERMLKIHEETFRKLAK